MHEVWAALVVILAMLGLAARGPPVLAHPARRGLLMLPYLAWLVFAAWLNCRIDAQPGRRKLVPGAASTDIAL